jgi:hypothetical protein
MKALQNLFSNPQIKFKVTKKNINNNKALLPNILYQQMENFIFILIADQNGLILENPKLTKLKLLKNAYLNDILCFKAEIIAINNEELNLLVLVNKENQSVICKAVFKLHLKEIISKAS